MTTLDNDINQHFQDAIDVIQQHTVDTGEYKYYDPLMRMCCHPVTHPSEVPGPYDWNEPTVSSQNKWLYLTSMVPELSQHHCNVWLIEHVLGWDLISGLSLPTYQPWPHVRVDDPLGPPVPMEYPQFYPITQRKGRKKLRLYEFLHEALGDPNTADSIQWTDRGTGTFHFISKNKEKLAECWGQRKGNRKTMTYQKMARALRNYSRTGEIVKVRRKLTYQFNPTILDRLGGIGHPVPSTGHSGVGHPGREVLLHQQHNPAEQSYYSSTAALEWHSWYGQYPLQGDYELAPSFPSSTVTKI